MNGVRDWPLLGGLDDEARAKLFGLARTCSFVRGDIVCRAGDPGDSVHFVEQGRLMVQLSLASGSTATLNLLGPGDFFGELALLRPHMARTATVTAMEPARTLAIPATAFRRLCVEQPQVERALTTLLAARVDQLSQELAAALYVGLEERVRRKLKDLSRMYARTNGGATIPVTQTQLAEMVGGARPSVNHVLQMLEESGVVALRRGRIEILRAADL
jgi:CRP-like cAMP-binding protein